MSPSRARSRNGGDGGGEVRRELRRAGPLNALGQPLGRHAGNRLLAGRVDGQHDHGVGVA